MGLQEANCNCREYTMSVCPCVVEEDEDWGIGVPQFPNSFMASVNHGNRAQF